MPADMGDDGQMNAPVTRLPIATDSSPLRPGQLIVHRLFHGEQLDSARTGLVVGHDERGLRLWYTDGNPGVGTCATDGRRIRDMPFAEWTRQQHTTEPIRWSGRDVLMLVRPADGPASDRAAHAVWWFYEPDAAFSWYVNLEEPSVLWYDGELAGVDTTDQDLDAVARPDGTWEWKDEDEFTERLGHPAHYWVRDEAAVRAEGERVARLFAAREFPFDGTWCDWRPDPAWRPPITVPPAVYRPRVR
jgi:hypothetical protein